MAWIVFGDGRVVEEERDPSEIEAVYSHAGREV